MLVTVAVLGLWPLHDAAAQAASPALVTGDELQAWFASDQMAVAGINLSNGCHWLTKGPMQARWQTVFCPNAEPFTVKGEAQVQGHRLCSKFVYPDGSRFEGCQEIYRIGQNRFENRIDGVPRSVFYRIVR
jgi:hypothetical protein